MYRHICHCESIVSSGSSVFHLLLNGTVNQPADYHHPDLGGVFQMCCSFSERLDICIDAFVPILPEMNLIFLIVPLCHCEYFGLCHCEGGTPQSNSCCIGSKSPPASGLIQFSI